MHIRSLMSAAFVPLLILASCTRSQAVPARPVPTPVPLATWIAGEIPADLRISYSYSHDPPSSLIAPLFDFQSQPPRSGLDSERLDIAADGVVTYASTHISRLDLENTEQKVTGQKVGRLSPEALKRVIMAFEENRFFYLTVERGCVIDVVDTPALRRAEDHAASGPWSTISISINGVSKSVVLDEGYRSCTGNFPDRGAQDFASLVRVLQETVKDLPWRLPGE